MTWVVKTFQKAEVERKRLYIDYECWLEDTEALADTQVTISPYDPDKPIVINTGYTDAAQKKLVMYVGGGAANTNYTLSIIIQTNQGQVKQDNLGLRVTS